MKKFLIAILSLTACLCLGLAAGCSGCDPEPDPKPEEYTFEITSDENTEYFGEFFTEGKSVYTVEADTVISFGVNVTEGYDLSVSANGASLTPADGLYTVTVKSNTKVVITGSVHVMGGSGTSENPYLVTSAYDLKVISERVNAGVPSYVYGYYVLENDIDVGGGELGIIGDGRVLESGSLATFVGFFNGQGHTISNFKINSKDVSYVGLFGNFSATGEADNSGIIQNLNLDSFEIEAVIPQPDNDDNTVDAAFVGSFYGSGVATNLVACSATNGSIFVTVPSGVSCFVGGAIGLQQSYAMVGNGAADYIYSATDYVKTSVDIDVAPGGPLYVAGGVVGYLFSADENAAASVVNCYSEGSILGAMRSGGIVGLLGNYSSVANCYSISEINGYADSFSNEQEAGAYAGGIVGYAAYGSVISGCFFDGEVDASVGNPNTQKLVDGICAGKEEASLFFNEVVIHNCYSGESVTLDAAFFNALGWPDCDWVKTAGKHPVINYEAYESNKFNLTLSFGSKTVAGFGVSRSFELSVGDNYYTPLSYYVGAGIVVDNFMSSDGYTSYGLFFDSNLTQKVPAGYIPTGDKTLYVGFKNYEEVAGNYYIAVGDNTARLTLNTNGTYTFVCGVSFPVSVDGVTYPLMTYTYDGETIHFKNGLFARLSSVTDSAAPQLNYEPYDFIGAVNGGTLSVYNGLEEGSGVYFTRENPLTALKTAPVEAHTAFYGAWEKSATINKKFNFNDESWTYTFRNINLSGSYSVNNGVATLSLQSGETYATAKIEDGLLYVTLNGSESEELFCYENSFYGVWHDPNMGATLYLDGYGTDLAGAAICYIGESGYELYYVVDGYFDSLTGHRTVTVLSGYSLFGYLYLDSDNTIVGSLFDVNTTALRGGYKFYLVDDYEGEWVGEDGNDFIILDFNGYGIYDVAASTNPVRAEVKGYLTVNGERVPYTVDAENGLVGTFTYNNVEYSFEIDDEAGVISVKGANTVVYERKDEWADFELIDSDKNIYSFNGGGKLSIGGVLTITSANGTKTGELVYKTDGEGIIEKLDKSSGNNTYVKLNLFENGNPAGTITIQNYKFVFGYTGSTAAFVALKDRRLNLHTPFTGLWAISGGDSIIKIGDIDLSLRTTGTFDKGSEGQQNFYYNIENNSIVFYYLPPDSEDYSPFTFYFSHLQEDDFILTGAGNNLYCTASDELRGTWVNTESRNQIAFDGLADSKFTPGIALDLTNHVTYTYTRRFGKIFAEEYSSEGKVVKLYEIEFVRPNSTGENIYGKGAERIRFTEIDENDPVLTATASNGTKYVVYLNGTVKVGTKEGSWLIADVKGSVTTIEITYKDNSTETVEIDVSNTESITATVVG